MKAAAVVVDYTALTTNMGKLATLNLERARAIEQIVAWAVEEEQAKRRHVLGTSRRIESKLRAAHFCTKDAGLSTAPAIGQRRALVEVLGLRESGGTLMSDDQPFYAPNRTPAPPRQPKPGEEVWRLTDGGGRVQACELRDNSRAGAGFEIQILEAGEILVSRRCANEQEARYVAEAAKKDLLRTGWAEEERAAIESKL